MQDQQKGSEGGRGGNYVGPMWFEGLQYRDARRRMTKMAGGGGDVGINGG